MECHPSRRAAQHRVFRCSRRSWLSNFRNALYLAALLIFSGASIGCGRIRSRAEVIGVYELNADHGRISLEVGRDDRFGETIVFASGLVERRAGQWHWNAGRLSFDGLWIPKSFAPDYILRADAENNTRQPKYTQQGHWVLTAEKHWGKVILPVFPDADISFRMVQRR